MADLPRTGISGQERIASLDILRGFALLGILIMNIQGYSMPGPAYLNPFAWPESPTGLDQLTFILAQIFVANKFRTIFTLLFGAGILLFSDRLEAKGRRPAGVHYRRTLWLLVGGMAHAYLLWAGDILVSYALCAFLVYPLRRRSARTLLIVGIALFAVPVLFYLFSQWSIGYWSEEEIESLRPIWSPSSTQIEAEIRDYRSGWIGQMTYRIISAIWVQTIPFIYQIFWSTSGLMLIGMALYRWGVLSATRSTRFYLRMLLIGAVIGLPPICIGLARNFAEGWRLEYSFFGGMIFNYIGSVPLAGAYVAGIMLLVRSRALMGLKRLLARYGQMALTNYIGQSALATLIFYGHGLALFATMGRAEQQLFVVAIWALQLPFSAIWLRHFRYGPLEWLWRTLTYLKPQPMRILTRRGLSNQSERR